MNFLQTTDKIKRLSTRWVRYLIYRFALYYHPMQRHESLLNFVSASNLTGVFCLWVCVGCFTMKLRWVFRLWVCEGWFKPWTSFLFILSKVQTSVLSVGEMHCKIAQSIFNHFLLSIHEEIKYNFPVETISPFPRLQSVSCKLIYLIYCTLVFAYTPVTLSLPKITFLMNMPSTLCCFKLT